MSLVYADNNATTSVAPEVVEVMRPFFEECYFNPSSMYEAATPANDAIEGARKSIAELTGAGDARQILFTSCATESNNAAIHGTLAARPGRRHIVTTAVEHPAVIEVLKDLERRGYRVTYLPVSEAGALDMAEFVQSLSSDVALVTIMHANNETGVIFPIEDLSRLTKEFDPDINFHTDATQTLGKLPIDLAGSFKHVDLLSFSGHKLHAPKGIGALFVRKGVPCRPFMLGGHQEQGRRAGTENVAFIVALAKAVELAMATREADEVRIEQMRDRLEKELVERIPAIQVNGKGSRRLANTTNIACHYVEGEGMLYQLSEEEICASSGSACTSGSLDPSHVLKAMNIPFTAMHGSIRFSLSRYNTDADIDRIIDVFPEVVDRLRRMSPYWDSEKQGPRESAD